MKTAAYAANLSAFSSPKASPGPPLYFISSFFCFPQTPVCLPFSVLHPYDVYFSFSAQWGPALCLCQIFPLSLEYGVRCIVEVVRTHPFMWNSWQTVGAHGSMCRKDLDPVPEKPTVLQKHADIFKVLWSSKMHFDRIEAKGLLFTFAC